MSGFLTDELCFLFYKAEEGEHHKERADESNVPINKEESRSERSREDDAEKAKGDGE